MTIKQFQIGVFSLIFVMIGTNCHSQKRSSYVKTQANYHNRDCLGGVGFCNGLGEVSRSSTGNTEISKLSDHSVVFSIPVNNFSSAEIIELFGANIDGVDPEITYEFHLNIDLELSVDVLNSLEIESKHKIIRSQFYPMKLVHGVVQITFILSQP